MGRGRPPLCPFCRGTKSVAKGYRYNKAGKVRLRRCKGCGRRWTVGPARDEPKPELSKEAPPEPQQADKCPGQEAPDSGAQSTETDVQTENERELPLSGEGSPSHEDPGKEREAESEETFFTQ